MAFMATFVGLGLSFYILLGFRYTLNPTRACSSLSLILTVDHMNPVPCLALMQLENTYSEDRVQGLGYKV